MVNLTDHVKIRYAERIAGRDTTIDVNTYVAQNLEKIENDIQKMVEYSDVIYVGVTDSSKNVRTVRLSGCWLIIMDNQDRTAITLYKIDFGLGEEFNKYYINTWLKKLSEDIEALTKRKEESIEELNAYRKAIKDNEGLIAEYMGLIKSLEKDNKSYQTIIENKQAEYSDLEMTVRRDVDALTKRREF